MAEPLRTDPIPFTVRRSGRAKRVRVLVHPDASVEVVLPQHAPDREAQRAATELHDWIERRVAEARATRQRNARPDGTVPFLGTDLVLVREPRRTRAHRRGDTLLVPEDPRTAVERWYRRTARGVVEPKVHGAAAALGRTCSKVTIRDQRTRWGSCSTSSAIAINWRLLLAPEPVLDYVVWHEACHLVHLDHSPRFWALLRRHVPSSDVAQRWLKQNGAALQLPPL